jgi:hypothetical protein
MVITGVTMDKGEKYGKAVFFDRETFTKVYEIPIEGAVSAPFLACYHLTDFVGAVKSVVNGHPWAKNVWLYKTDGCLGQIVLIGNVPQRDKNRVAA